MSISPSRILPACAVFCASLCMAAAQDLAPGAPLVDRHVEEAAALHSRFVLDASVAGEALRMGFPSVAEPMLSGLLAAAQDPAGRDRTGLMLATARIELGDADGALAALEAVADRASPGFRVRRAAALLLKGDGPGAGSALDGLQPGQLAGDEAAWYHFARGQVADAAGDYAAAQAAYEQAQNLASTAALKARFYAAQVRSRLLSGRAAAAGESSEVVARLRRQVEEYMGRRIGTEFARQYAAVLDGMGRHAEAVQVLERQLAVLPPEEGAQADNIRMLLALIAGPGSAVGHKHLNLLVAGAGSADVRRAALQMLVDAATTGVAQEQLSREIDVLLAGEPPSPVTEELLLARAHVGWRSGDHAAAEQFSEALLTRFPGSPLAADALAVQTAVAWELRRYRTAADLAKRWRDAAGAGMGTELDILRAEASFRAADYQNAAEAYEAALAETPEPGDRRDVLVFQRVLSSVRAGRLDEAAARLDRFIAEWTVSTATIWQAEWSLAKAFQLRGDVKAARARVDRLLAADVRPSDGGLRMRLRWLQARLAFEAGDSEQAFTLAGNLLSTIEGGGIDPALAREVAGTLMLLQVQARFAQGRDEEAGVLLGTLRSGYAGTDAAVYSFIVQAAHLASQNRTVDAQSALIELLQKHRNSPYASFALYEAAGNAERTGGRAQLEAAYRLLEQLTTDFPRDGLVFYARLRQGDILRKLDQFGAAQQIYEYLVINQSSHPDVLQAELALADCLSAQSAADPAKFESAIARYERLLDLPGAPADLRVEAGFKAGYALARAGQNQAAGSVFTAVAAVFLADGRMHPALGVRGRHWLARTLIEHGAVLEQSGRSREAAQAYELIIATGLTGQNLARARLAHLHINAGATPESPP